MKGPVQQPVPSVGKISFNKLVIYNIMFFLPILLCLILLTKVGQRTSAYFQASPPVIAKVLLIPLICVIFIMIIPFLRKRESVQGIRYSILAFICIAILLSLPSIITERDFGLLFVLMVYAGIYILLTFFFCPEVLGVEKNLGDWFRHRKQMQVSAIYLCVVLLFILGFAGICHEIYSDPANPAAFAVSADEKPTLPTFMYYSMVSFTTTGYGDILPASPLARLTFFFEALIGLVLNVLFIAILLMFISGAQVPHKEDVPAGQHSRKNSR